MYHQHRRHSGSLQWSRRHPRPIARNVGRTFDDEIEPIMRDCLRTTDTTSAPPRQFQHSRVRAAPHHHIQDRVRSRTLALGTRWKQRALGKSKVALKICRKPTSEVSHRGFRPILVKGAPRLPAKFNRQQCQEFVPLSSNFVAQSNTTVITFREFGT